MAGALQRSKSAGGALLAALLLAGACAKAPSAGFDVVTPGSAHVRVGRIDRSELETVIRSAPPNLRERTEYLVDLMWQAGCLAVEMAPEETRTPDVLCSLPGRTKQRIIVVAHLDREVEGDGVPRHWSGTAVLPFLYRALGVEEREHSFEFAAFGKSGKGRDQHQHHPSRTGSPFFGDDVSAIVEIQDLDPERIGFTATDPAMGQDFVDTNLAVGRPIESLLAFDHRRLRSRRPRIPMLVIVSPTKIGEEEPPAVSAGPDGHGGYQSAARLVAAYLGYIDERLTTRPRAPAPAASGAR